MDFRAFLELVLPSPCAGCGAATGAAGSLCADCAGLLRGLRRCYPHDLGSMAAEEPTPPLYTFARYTGALRDALLAYKERRRRELARVFGAALAQALHRGRSRFADGAGMVWLVPAPSRRWAALRRGGQHMVPVAEHAAAGLATRGTAAAVAPALRVRAGAQDSVGLTAGDRVANLAGRIAVRHSGLPPDGSAVVLVDDVLTTGATAATCVSTLARSGVAVSAIVVFGVAGRYATWP